MCVYAPICVCLPVPPSPVVPPNSHKHTQPIPTPKTQADEVIRDLQTAPTNHLPPPLRSLGRRSLRRLLVLPLPLTNSKAKKPRHRLLLPSPSPPPPSATAAGAAAATTNGGDDDDNDDEEEGGNTPPSNADSGAGGDWERARAAVWAEAQRRQAEGGRRAL